MKTLEIIETFDVIEDGGAGSQFEVSVPTRFLEEGAFLVQGIQALPPKYFLHRLGILTPDQLRQVEKGLLLWQGISSP